MGVTGKGLRADGLHKQYLNGSQEDHNSAAHKTRTGGNVSIDNKYGLNKQFGSHLPMEAGTPGKSPIKNGPIKKLSGA